MNEKSDSLRSKRRSSLQRRMADTPHGAHHPTRKTGRRKELKRSIYYGTLLYILRTEVDRLTPEQQSWIARYSLKLEEQELERAGRHAELLLRDSKVQYFHVRDILRVRSSIPWIEPFNPPESVRIGKGYTDKGALRPLHERGRQLSEIKFWDADIPFMLPTFYTVKGEWITADEVKSLLGETVFGLVMMSLNQMVNPASTLLSQLQMIQSRDE